MNELDERYSVADEAIFDAFFILVKEKGLDKVTVADVTKKAGVVRSTFYNHYENIPALIVAAEEKTINDIFTMMESFHPHNDRDICKSFFLAICNYTKSNPFLTDLLESARGDSFFEKAITMFHEYVSKTLDILPANGDNKKSASFLISASIGATIGILHKWIAEDFISSADEVADILTNLFLSGIMPYLC